jgi:predicted O-methyltransferase YrrM
MYSRFRLAQKYIRFYLSASNGKGHGTHSPFVFDFIEKVLNDRSRYAAYSDIEMLRSQLLHDETFLDIEDLGAGSKRRDSRRAGPEPNGSRRAGPAPSDSRRRRIADITRHAAKPARLGQLLFRVARHYRPRIVLEMGTSLGISTAYLAAGALRSAVWSIEGSGAVAATAAMNLRSLELENTEIVTGNFDMVLDPLLDKIGPVDLAFVDGNHRFEPTMRYFDTLMRQSRRPATLIFDDIHWSREMEQAWTAIREDPRVYLTIDLFFIGFVFLRDEFKVKQEFMIRF